MLNLKLFIIIFILLISFETTLLRAGNQIEEVQTEEGYISYAKQESRIEKLQKEKGYLTFGTVWTSLNLWPASVYYPDSFNFFILEDGSTAKQYNYWIQLCVVHEDLPIIIQDIWRYLDHIILKHISNELYEATNLRTQTSVHVRYNEYPYIESESSWE